jgi:hypothetical protein
MTKADTRKFLLAEYSSQISREGNVSMDPELTRVGVLLGKLGWMKTGKIEGAIPAYLTADIENAVKWMEDLPYGIVISKGIIVPGAGRNLDILDFQSNREEFVRMESEKLLRHVESRRKRSLDQFTVDLDAWQILGEKIGISVFFSRHALRCGDLRFINAAFKLNEWLMDSHRRFRKNILRALFLVALAEQETCAAELLA